MADGAALSIWPDRRGSRLRTGIRRMAGGGMRRSRPKISRRAETRPYGRVSAPTRNCRRFLTQLWNRHLRSVDRRLRRSMADTGRFRIGVVRCLRAGVPSSDVCTARRRHGSRSPENFAPSHKGLRQTRSIRNAKILDTTLKGTSRPAYG